MTEPDLEAILDECLHGMSTRAETIERCLQRYPQHAGQLAPLIQVADRIREASHPTLSVSATKAVEQRLLKRATELRQSEAKSSCWSFPFSLRPLGTVAAMLIVVLALVLAGGGGIVYASTDSLPGSPLYGVKRAAEQAQLFLAPAGTKRVELHIKFAQRRLEEVQALAEIKGQVDEEALAAIAEETELALEGIEKAPAQDKSALLDKLVSLTERQQAVLEEVWAEAPEAAQKGLNRALEASQRGREKAREALEKEKPGRGVKPIKSPVLTGTPKPIKAPKATPTPKANRTLKPDTPRPTHTPKPTKASDPTYEAGVRGQGQGLPSMPPGQEKDKEESSGPPAEPPGQAKDKEESSGPPAEPPGQEKDKEEGSGPPAEPPGQSGEDHGGGHGKGRGKVKAK
jgi:hypothetical protein